MTILDVINRLDNLKPNRYDTYEKIKWLSTLDERIFNDILKKYEDQPTQDFVGYTDETPLGTELLVHNPHDVLYLYWIEAQIDYWNGETQRYNNSIDLFNTEYDAFQRNFHRTHMPKGNKLKFF